MKANYVLFWVVAVFCYIAAAVYTYWAVIDEYSVGTVEWVGTVGLVLCGVLASLIAFYVQRVYKAQGGELPEDRLDASIDDGEAEQGFFSPWSWWPVMLAAGAALAFLGLAVGVWIAAIGGAVVLVSLVGWVYEYHRGYFGH